jgi:large subunit ribosomal protein L22
MIIKATQKNTRQTALKVRLVANQVRKLSLVDAMKQLSVIQKRSSLVLLKVLRQAIADAMHNHGYQLSDLTLKNIIVVPGPTYKRYRAVSRGRGHTIFKRTCHITVELKASTVSKAVPDEDKASKAKKVTQVKNVAEITDAPIVQQPVVAQKLKKVTPTNVVVKKQTSRVRKSGTK